MNNYFRKYINVPKKNRQRNQESKFKYDVQSKKKKKNLTSLQKYLKHKYFCRN